MFLRLFSDIKFVIFFVIGFDDVLKFYFIVCMYIIYVILSFIYKKEMERDEKEIIDFGVLYCF